jgi:hypothetical protein
MAFDFPAAPAADQIFTDTASGASYVWSGEAWKALGGNGADAGASFPEAPTDGKVYGRQGLTASWVEVAPNLPRPTIASVAPASSDNAAAPVLLTVTGTLFDVSSEIYIGQNAMPTTYVSATQLTTETVAGMTPGTYAMTVVSAGLAAIPPINFTVT